MTQSRPAWRLAVALSKIGPQPAAEKAVSTIVTVLEDPKVDTKVRERVVWALRVHKLNLANFPTVYPAFAKILSESKNPETRHAALRLCLYAGGPSSADAPQRTLDVLSEFLKDETILIFKGKGGRKPERRALRRIRTRPSHR